VGRDVLSRVIWGTRVSLVAGLVSVVLAVSAGSLLGVVAGYCGGRVDGLVMRVMDAVLSFPPLVLALALGAVLGAGLTGVLLALGVVYTPTFARLMRGQVLTITARDYVDAARALGASGWRVAARHVVPNAINPIIVQASLSVAFAILAERRLVPRARHPAPGGLVGQHDQRRPRLSPAGALDRLRAGRGALRDRGGIELRGRCGARRARSPDARVGER
jgi:ABC-type dipeptide/oligopeptide/nickel transport system permease subunit